MALHGAPWGSFHMRAPAGAESTCCSKTKCVLYGRCPATVLPGSQTAADWDPVGLIAHLEQGTLGSHPLLGAQQEGPAGGRQGLLDPREGVVA